MLITGGWNAKKSAEIYHLDHDTPCVLPDLPEYHVHHTQEGSLVCGGRWTLRSCQRWNPDTGGWDLVTESLTWSRQHHTSWTPVNGSVTYLMGGSPSAYPSEVVDLDNGQVNESFPLHHPAFPLQ